MEVITAKLLDLIQNVHVVALFLCALLHFFATKRKDIVALCGILLTLQMFNWIIHPYVFNHEQATLIWNITWMATDLPVLLFIAWQAISLGRVDKVQRDVAFFTCVFILLNFSRFIERHYTEATLVKFVYPYAVNALNFIVIMILLLPAVKAFVHYLGRQLNGTIIFGLRISVSSVRSSIVLADSEGLSRQNRRY